MSTICHKNAFRWFSFKFSPILDFLLNPVHYYLLCLWLILGHSFGGQMRSRFIKIELQSHRSRQSLLQWLSTYNIIITRVDKNQKADQRHINRPTEGNNSSNHLLVCMSVYDRNSLCSTGTFAIDRSFHKRSPFCHRYNI